MSDPSAAAAPCPWHEEGAVQALLDSQRPRLLALFTRYRIPPEDVEDLLQQALLALVYQHERIRTPGSWLVGTVRNCCRTYWTERSRQVYEAVDQRVLDGLPSDEANRQELHDLRHDLSQLVAELPPRTRELIRLRYLWGYEPAEAAAALGYSPASVSKTTLRAFAKLSRRLVPQGGVLLALTVAVLLALPASAQTSDCSNDDPWDVFKTPEAETNDVDLNCSSLNRCYTAEDLGHEIRLADPGCDPTAGSCQIRLSVRLRFAGNQQTIAERGGFAPKPTIWWYTGAEAPACNPTTTAACSQQAVAVCGSGLDQDIDQDVVETFLLVGASCDQLQGASPPAQLQSFSLLAYACPTSSLSCRKRKEIEGLDFSPQAVAAAIGCPVPRKDECRECLANVGSGMGKTPVGGGPACAAPVDSGPGAMLRYAGGGVGRMGLPGTAEWAPTLGRNWSHDYAARIVEDPDDSHVWLLTRWATFREFSDLVGGVYTTVSPSDEYRTLERTGIGWTLTGLDGTVTELDAAGLWLSTTDRNGNAKTATYTGGQLTSVAFPDGRREDFTYSGARLATITEVGTDGLTSRAWSYTWSGDDLVRIDRPDGTALVMSYGDPSHPGHLTLLELEGADGASRRVEQGWEYDAHGNAVRTWSGAASFADTAAVDKWELSFNDPVDPTVTTVTDPLGQQIVYTIGRDSASDKPRVEQVSGGCPGCGLESDTTFVYGATHPLLPIQQTDANGNVTSFTYTAFGQVASRTEAFGVTGLERTTTFTYDLNFPALVTEIEQPSTAGGGNSRRTSIVRDAVTGDAESRTIEGIETGVPFGYTTTTTYNAAGQPLSIDPPAYDAADVTTFTYDATGLVPASRTDPLAGTTTFSHDAFLRRTSVTDANAVETTTAYNALGRVTEVRQIGASSPAEDLVTTHTYDAFGDLAATTLPEGNQILYGYDAAGRLTSIERRSADGSKRERTVYTLDGAGNRTAEELQSWDGAAWVTKSSTTFEYISRCHLGRVLHPDGTATRYDYDCNGNLEGVWDANHPFVDEVSTPPTESYLYDALDRLVEVRQPWSGAGDAVTTYTYDVQDHLTAVTDAEGNTTTYAYSDRDLLTQEVSPASGTTTHAYNEHGELVSTTDARSVVTTRTVDEADRVTKIAYPDPTLDITYAYGTNPTLFEVGRLTGITRNSQTIAYTYDRFGRLTQDGALTYGYDRNGNRTTIGYPGGVEASSTFDFADREATLSVTSPAGTQPVVTSSAYLPSGPLTSLALGNGATETRAFTSRYFPASIALDATRNRTYAYATDAVGNVTSITETVECLAGVLLENRTITGAELHQSCDEATAGPAVEVAPGGSLTLRAATRVVLRDGFSVASGATFTAGTDPALDGSTWDFDYQDPQYFLASATGPWGDLAWTYDRIGNRLTETRDGATDTYDYTDNPAGGNTPLLEDVQLAVGGLRAFTYGAAGHLEAVDSAGNLVDFTYDAAGRLASAERAGNATPFAYDGRSYLTAAGAPAGPLGATQPSYSSAGLLHTLDQRVTATDAGRTHHVFHFAGRPVAQLTVDDGAETWRYLTTDHLGTPLVATDAAGAELWAGPFEPFGRDRLEATNLAAAAEDVFLRFPGQWDDEVWRETMRGGDAYYNLHRWYLFQIGRYSKPDPVGLGAGIHLYNYAVANPVLYFDPLGEKVCRCDRRLATPLMALNVGLDPAAHHSYVQIVPDNRDCGGYDGVAWGFQATGGGRVLPERTPAFNPQIQCQEVSCIDEQKLLQNIVRDMKSPPYSYQAVCRIGRGWNERNCQGWADDILDRSRKQPCCD